MDQIKKKRISLTGDDKIELLLEVARAYYEQNHDQGKIAQSLGISRSQVSRYLAQARELNLVQVRVIAPNERSSSLEDALKSRFPYLNEAIVVPVFNPRPDPLRKIIGRAGAQHLDRIVEPGRSICVGSGRTLSEVFSWLHHKSVPKVSIIQA